MESVRDVLINIKKVGIEIQEKLDKEKLNDNSSDLSKEFNFSGDLAVFNNTCNATRLILKPVKLDERVIRLGLINKELHLFNSNERPIILPAIFTKLYKKTKEENKDVSKLPINPQEELLVNFVDYNCKSADAKNNLLNLLDELKNIDLKQIKTVKKNMNKCL